MFKKILLNVCTSLLFAGMAFSQTTNTCEDVKDGAAAATLFTKSSVYNFALSGIKNAFVIDKYEHCISFGKDAANNIIASPILNGAATSGKVPAIANAFADLHNHPDNTPPDAGDFYGLININKNNPTYKTRFVVTLDGTLYALLVTDTAAINVFSVKYPRQPPAFAGGPPGFAVSITDEAREMKYKYHCTDEMVVAFILEKYNTGVSLLKQHSNGTFKKIITVVSKNRKGLVFSAGSCP